MRRTGDRGDLRRSRADVLRAAPTPACPTRAGWSTEKYLRFTPTLFAQARDDFGSTSICCTTCTTGSPPSRPARLGKGLEPYALTWLEDPVPAELQEAFRLIRQHTTTPIAVGEVFNSDLGLRAADPEQLIDYIRATVVHAGGITSPARIFDLAAPVPRAHRLHGATDLSPVCMAAAVHSTRHAQLRRSRSTRGTPSATDEVFPHGYHFADGYLRPGDEPGLGVDIDEKLAAQYPYQRAYLPVSRKVDGSVGSW